MHRVTEPEQQPSIADLARSAIGSHELVAPRPVAQDTSHRGWLVPLGILTLVVGLGIGGIAYHWYQSRSFHSNDPAVAFSDPTPEEAEQLKELEGLAANPHAHLVVRASHVTYRPVDSGVEEPGLAVELKARSIGDHVGLLPLDVIDEPALELGGGYVLTVHEGTRWTQVVETEDRLFMASGEDTTETTAILRAMLADEGLDP